MSATLAERGTGREAGGDLGDAARLARHDRQCRSQNDRQALSPHVDDVSSLGGSGSADHAQPARRERGTTSLARCVQRVVQHARCDDDFSLRRPCAVRLQQLPVATHARRPRHGVPATQRAVVLDVSDRGHFPVHQPAARRHAERRLVRLTCPTPRASTIPVSTSTSTR